MRFGIMAAAVLLAGCGGGTPAEEGPAGRPEVKLAGPGAGEVAPPANLPPFAPLYPGARVTTTTLNPQDPGKGMMAMAVPNADSAAIIAFYRSKGEAAGLKADMETASGPARIMIMSEGNETAGDEGRGMQVTAAPDDEGGSIVTLVYTDGK
ncbi:hypothetical protein [Sphingomonas colocasiae]|uniref:Lipoprotein n=1 Tax=Sphingomonas colocasiae TaxID=1848973 RepID=A0ABS7PUW3_9SPHN|nr:hypothetical protein [Sphingomonas colocasiae]MBY8825160.1 hypothetical protein [Sphingomonas colocasiae]